MSQSKDRTSGMKGNVMLDETGNNYPSGSNLRTQFLQTHKIIKIDAFHTLE